MAAYLVKFEPCDPGLRVSGTTITRGVTKPESAPLSVVLLPSSAQLQGLYGYIALINASVDTSTIETAVGALTP